MKYSIITATYNHAKTLPRLLESLGNQTERDFELIICDDGSTDGTTDILSEKLNFPLRVVGQDHRGMRLAKNINNGIRVARGDYCVFIMGDSFPETDYLERLNGFVGEDKIVCGCRVNVDGNRIVGFDWRLAKGRIPEYPALIPEYPFNAITGNGLTVPTAALREHGGWCEELEGYGGDDNELVARLYFLGYLVYSVPQLILFHNYHVSTADEEENNEKVSKLMKKYAGKDID